MERDLIRIGHPYEVRRQLMRLAYQPEDPGPTQLDYIRRANKSAAVYMKKLRADRQHFKRQKKTNRKLNRDRGLPYETVKRKRHNHRPRRK